MTIVLTLRAGDVTSVQTTDGTVNQYALFGDPPDLLRFNSEADEGIEPGQQYTVTIAPVEE